MKGRAVSVNQLGKIPLKMKITAVSVCAVSLAISLFTSAFGLLFAATFTLAFAFYGMVGSRTKGIDPLNDLPNAVRVGFAALGGYLLAIPYSFIVVVLGILFVATGLLLNDEYQRRTLDSFRSGRRGGSIAVLGIDGSGKSTHSAKLVEWFASRGYISSYVPFHKYLFVEALSRTRNSGSPRGKRGVGNPLRPLISLIDNLLLNLETSFGSGAEGRVVIYDRYIWSTYVK